MSEFRTSSVPPTTEKELEQIAQLVVAVSRRLAHVHLETMRPAIEEALERVAAEMSVEACALIEFAESGAVAQVYGPVAADGTALPAGEPMLDGWFTARLARGEVVTVTRPEALLPEGVALPEDAASTCEMLGVPALVAGEVVCALVMESSRFPRQWMPALVERLELLVEILGSALQRGRDEIALRAHVATIAQLNSRLEADNVYLKEEIKTYHDFDDIVGESPALRLALDRLGQVATANSSVLLLGPTGTGKELFARALHERSRRHARPLVRVNCAALPPTLVESELFGHEKGAFTGAVSLRQGRFELADGGTIFLDEIGDLTPDIQVKFLRVLQEGEFERVGSSRTRKVDVRVIAATHHDLEAAVAEGRFRADLYYRLSVYPIRLPSLEQRVEDIPRLVWFFIHRHQRELDRRITKVPQAVMEALQRHTWPGNVRELENVVERAMIATKGEVLQLDEDPVGSAKPDVAPAGEADALDQVQRAHIKAVLERCGWRINGSGNAAERLAIHPNTLRFRMKKLGVVCPDGRDRHRQQKTAE